MFEQLFGSKTRVKLLQLFYTNPNRSFYVREITRKIDEQINSVRRELSNLLGIGIITSDATNNRLYYEVNQKYEHYQSLATIFGGLAAASADVKSVESKKSKTKVAPEPTKEEPEHPLAKEFRTIGKIDLVIFTGQFTRDESSGVDILIVGDVNQAKASRFMSDLEKTEGKELRYVILQPSNYAYRLQINDRFLTNLLNSKKQIIIKNQELTLK